VRPVASSSSNVSGERGGGNGKGRPRRDANDDEWRVILEAARAGGKKTLSLHSLFFFFGLFSLCKKKKGEISSEKKGAMQFLVLPAGESERNAS